METPVKAHDFDGSFPNNQIVYRIQYGAADKFTIETETGIVRVARGASLDPDLTQPRKMVYPFKVLAIDGAPGDGQLQASTDVVINIIDVNIKGPVFDDPGNIAVFENTPVGKIIANLSANDPDSTATLVFKIDDSACQAMNERRVLVKTQEYDCSGAFHLEPRTGVVSIGKTLDREIVEQFQLGLTVEDINSETGQQVEHAKIVIDILDVNDNSPNFRNSFYKFSIAENSKHGTAIGSVTADDIDKNKTITYSLEGIMELTSLVHLNQDVIAK